ncbi:fungal-specific transcription factor domain-containing protein [Aspergillus pseudotamarii]|uniref:Fungal-specific transcription factor domain-containing protein n=1 Tax=Aspergillus pseudotamarii TaxID=132259 RepID=A0A5N6SH93_ASPPS|nr:fungal-specific transcription factor domain-containing protein [Aspergillus pseudotamarii]KAE8134088.1 fungal-specific transcription factor domain-containing protein [Aspergillus pseudotamarii]
MSFPPAESTQSANQSQYGSDPLLRTSPPAISHATQDNGQRSCITCRRRKVRCNKKCPCVNCVKAGIECVFPPPGRAPRKSKRPHDAELLSRLKRLEGVIEHLSEKNASLSTVPSPTQQRSGSVTIAECPGSAEPPNAEPDGCPFDPKRKPRNLEHEFGRLVIEEGRSRYVNNRLWASLGDEIEELQDLLDPSSSEDEDHPSPASSSTHSTNHDGFLFGFYSLSHSLRSFHPPPLKVPLLWQAYLENVDPLMPIIHKPSAKQLFKNATDHPDSLDKNSEALLLSMYFVTIISLTPDQCLTLLGEERDTAVSRYRFAVEQALSKANLLNTQSLMLLQAAVIFLIAVRREDDTKFVWSMTSLVIRLAQGLGLHRDGTNFGLKPFETEMRRRLWWHIGLLDIRSSEDHGTETQITERMYDTRLPLNINDDDIYPEMQEPPEERTNFTEMSFSLMRFEITTALRRVSYACPNTNIPGPQQPSPEKCGNLIQIVNKRIEERYIQHCDMNVPIQWVTATVARLILTKLWLVVHHPMTRPYQGINLTNSSRENLFLASVEVAEFACLLSADKNTQKWGWMFAINMQWHAIAFVLAELCVRPINPLTERAWTSVSTLYGGWVQTAKHRKGMLWRPLARLMKRAADHRAKLQQQMHTQPGPSTVASSSTASLSMADGPKIMDSPILPRIPDFQFSPSTLPDTTSTNPSLSDIDFRKGGPMGVMTDLFPEVDWLSLPTPGDSLGQQPAANPAPAIGIPEGSALPPEFPQDSSNLQVNWDEWDQVMRDFQMDMRDVQPINPMGNIPNNVSGWFT